MAISDIIIMFEAYWLMVFCVPLPVLCAGNIVGISATLTLIILTEFYSEFFLFLKNVISYGAAGIIALSLFALAVLFILIYVIILSFKMQKAAANRPLSDEPCTLIVLGCRIIGDRPTRMLRKRLEAALGYMSGNENAVCIVSGGKGDDEDSSEASVMERYLLSRGVDENRIYSESRSRTTLENLNNSFSIIKNRGLPSSVVIVTDAFHQYRASRLARRSGIEVKAVSSSTEPLYAPTYWVREWLAVSAYMIKRTR